MVRTLFSRLMMAVLGSWFVASVLCQIPKAPFLWLRRWDLLGLIPEWKFFAPTPGTMDYYLLYRDQLDDGTLTDWTEVPLLEPRLWSEVLWNSGKRQEKALFDLISELNKEAKFVLESPELSLKAIQGTVCYLSLLNFVSLHLPHPEACKFTQFLVMMVANDGASAQAPTIVFLSDLHKLFTATEKGAHPMRPVASPGPRSHLGSARLNGPLI